MNDNDLLAVEVVKVVELSVLQCALISRAINTEINLLHRLYNINTDDLDDHFANQVAALEQAMQLINNKHSEVLIITHHA